MLQQSMHRLADRASRNNIAISRQPLGFRGLDAEVRVEVNRSLLSIAIRITTTST